MIFGNKKYSNNFGVDIGTKSIKIVEVSKKKNEVILENYAELNLDFAYRDFFRSFDKNTLNPNIDNISKALEALIVEAEIKNNTATFSLPDFATFYSSFDMPLMSEEEIDEAIGFEARKYIPLPLSEVVLDWQLISQDELVEKKAKSKVLVMAVPKIVVGQYKEIAQKAGVTLESVEAEAMALKRALLFKEEKNSACLVEIGYQSTNVSIIKDGFMRMSFSFDFAGKDLTSIIAEKFNVDTHEAEKAKRKYGIIENGELSLKEILEPAISKISEKIKKILEDLQKEESVSTERIILSGGTSLMPGFLDYFRSFFNGINVETGKPFEKIQYNKSLEEKMVDINANYAVALGGALRKFQ